MLVEVEKDEMLEIKVGDRIWEFAANTEDEAFLMSQSKGCRYVHAEVMIKPYFLTDRVTGARLNVIADK
jgi:hypothetical protein